MSAHDAPAQDDPHSTNESNPSRQPTNRDLHNSRRKANVMWQRRMVMVGAPLLIIGASLTAKALWPNRESTAANPPANGPQSQQSPQQVARNNAPQNNSPAGQVKTLPAMNKTSGKDELTAKIVASINGEEIARAELAKECLARYGKPVIESMINRQLIQNYCDQVGVQVTQKDVQEEIDRLARKFGMSVEDYLKMLKTERGIQTEQYGNEIIWPTLALRRLAAKQIQPSDREVAEAFESQYGEAIKARLIVLETPQDAERVYALVKQNPDDFGSLARQHSKDPSASVGGLIQPVRRFLGEQSLEQAAFALQEGEVSPVVRLQLPGAEKNAPGSVQYLIIKCEGRLKPMQVERAAVEARLRDQIVDRKLREEAGKLFAKLEQQAEQQRAIINIYNDAELSKQYPGIAARVFQREITIAQLAEECVVRHGIEVLEGVVTQRLLQQSLKAHQLQISQDDIDAEVANAAVRNGKITRNGGADIEGWLKTVLSEKGVTMKNYVEDAVWPSVALKKLAGDVQINDEDLRKGYEANYGQRVKCRAIVMNNLRKTQDVWQQARSNPTVEYFGQLAEQNSLDPSTKALQGKIPPLQRHGGQKLLEEEAFKLKPNELSSIVNVGENYVILYCEGFTQPSKIPFAEVKEMLHQDILEKKQRVAMLQTFNSLKENAQIDNYLAGTTHYPTKPSSYQRAADGANNVPMSKTPQTK